MTTLTEGRHAGEFLASEAGGTRSREVATILSGEDLAAGAVLGKVTKGAASSAADAGNTGDGTMGAVTVGAGAKPGAYTLTIIEPGTNAGDFVVEDPDGINVGAGDVASAFSGGGLSFTLADGATDFVAGDQFTITVAAGSGKYKEYDPTNTDGSETAVAVLYDNVDATGGDVTDAVIVARDAEVVSAALQWFSGATANQKATGESELADAGIIAR